MQAAGVWGKRRESPERKNTEEENKTSKQKEPQAEKEALIKAFHAFLDPFLLFLKNGDKEYRGIGDDAFLHDKEQIGAQQEVLERFWQKRDRNIDSYLKKHRNLSKEDRAVFQSWKKVRTMEYAAVETTDLGIALYRDGSVFEIVSAVPGQPLAPYLPGLTRAAVVPFAGKLFCPGFRIGLEETFDEGLKDRVKELAGKAREAGRWYQTLPEGGALQDPTKPAIAEKTVRTYACRIVPRKAKSVFRVIGISQDATFDSLAAIIQEEFGLGAETSYEFAFGRSIRDKGAIRLLSPEALRMADPFAAEPTNHLLRDAVQDLGPAFWFRYGEGEKWVFRVQVEGSVRCLADGLIDRGNWYWKEYEAEGTLEEKPGAARAAGKKDAAEQTEKAAAASPAENTQEEAGEDGQEFLERFHALYDPLLLSVKNGDKKWNCIPDEIFLHADSIFSQEYDQVSEELWRHMPKYVDAYLKKKKHLAQEAQNTLRSWRDLAEADYLAVERTQEGGFLYRDGNLFEVVNDKLPACRKSDLPTQVSGILLLFAGKLVVPCLLFYIYSMDEPVQRLAREKVKEAKKAGHCYRTFPEGKAPALSKEPPLGKELVLCYDMKVYPKGSGRQVYRQFRIACHATFDDLADAILEYFDFDWDHLYEFVFGKKIYQRRNFTIPCPEAKRGSWDHTSEDPDTTAELFDYIGGKGTSLLFHYDFGDDWVFQIHVNRLVGVLPQEGEDTDSAMVDLIASKGKIQQYPDWDDGEEVEEEDEDEDEGDDGEDLS